MVLGRNEHDLEGMLAHYAPDIELSSPFVAAVSGRKSGSVVGIDALRDYWSQALERFPDLHFEPISVLPGVESIVLHTTASAA